MSLGAAKASGGGSNNANSKGGKSGGSGKHNHISSHNHHGGGKNADKSHHKTQSAATLIIDSDDVNSYKNKVLDLMEMTRRSEEEVCSALHDCDQDMAKACDMLFEEADKTQGQWQTKEKKKKKSAAVSGGANSTSGSAGAGVGANSGNNVKGGEEEDWAADSGQPRDHRPARGRSNSRPYRGGRSGGEYHSNADDGSGGEGGRGARRGGRGGPGGMGRGGRGGGGGGRISRGGGRGGRGGRGRPAYSTGGMGGMSSSHNEMESWDNTDMGNYAFPPAEDWDNEEWSGSLADTKVFTPSAPVGDGGLANSLVTGLGLGLQQSQTQQDHHSMDMDSGIMQDTSLSLSDMQHGSVQDTTPDYLKQPNMPVDTSQSASQQHQHSLQDPAIYGYSSNMMALGSNANNPVVSNTTTNQYSMNKVAQNPSSATLSAAQSQYLSQLTQKSSETLKQDARSLLNSQVYAANYGVYNTSDMSNQRKPLQRVRVPPPSKIPSSAVEMPGEQVGSGTSVGLLDVQFGALDFSENNTFLSDNSSALDHHGMSEQQIPQQASQVQVQQQQQQQQSVLNNIVSSNNTGLTHQSATSVGGSSQQTNDHHYSTPSSQQMLSSESLSAAVAIEQQNSSSQGSMSSSNVASMNSSSNSGGISTSVNSSSMNSSNNIVSMSNVVPSAQSNITSHQTYVPSSGQHRTQQQHQSIPISQHPVSHLTTVSSLESQLTGGSKATDVSAQPSVYSSYPGQTYSSKQQAYHPTHHTYQTNPYSQNSSVYGNSGLYTSNVPYNSYQTLQATTNKITSNVKDSQYDSTVTSSTNSLSNTPPTQTIVKTTLPSGKSSVSSSVSGVGTGGHVGTVMGQYIMGTQPFYQQTLPYPYEDMQMLQQRLPHHVAGYHYDMGYTSSRAPPEASMASFPSLTSDARFGRSGGASSPSGAGAQGGQGGSVGGGQGVGVGAGSVAQSGGTPTGAQQQGMVAPYAAYYYSGGIMPAGGYPPYGTPPLYPIATGGGSGSSSYGSGKGGYVSTTYGAPQPQQPTNQPSYDQQQPSQQQDYKTGSYSSSQQSNSVKQASVNNSAVSGVAATGGSDLNSAMYGPTKHVSLGKVNSYDKAAYHSGTPPPPFGAGSVSVGGNAYTPGPHPLYIQHSAMPPPPTHQQDNGTNSSRTGSSGQSKPSAKQNYTGSYWNAN